MKLTRTAWFPLSIVIDRPQPELFPEKPVIEKRRGKVLDAERVKTRQ